eukprot:scaffold43215_cov46-Phaeocystis_antarctica.AAC.2
MPGKLTRRTAWKKLLPACRSPRSTSDGPDGPAACREAPAACSMDHERLSQPAPRGLGSSKKGKKCLQARGIYPRVPTFERAWSPSTQHNQHHQPRHARHRHRATLLLGTQHRRRQAAAEGCLRQ